MIICFKKGDKVFFWGFNSLWVQLGHQHQGNHDRQGLPARGNTHSLVFRPDLKNQGTSSFQYRKVVYCITAINIQRLMNKHNVDHFKSSEM